MKCKFNYITLCSFFFAIILTCKTYSQSRKDSILNVIDSVSFYGTIVEASYINKYGVVDRPIFYVFFDTAFNMNNILSRDSLNKLEYENSNFSFLSFDKYFFGRLNYELFEDTLFKGNRLINFLETQYKGWKYIQFKDSPKYYYKVYKGLLKCLRMNVPKSRLVDSIVFRSDLIEDDIITIFIVYDAGN